MQPKKYANLGTSIKTLSLAIASSCLIYSAADATGLGKLTVLSSLGQPLRAEIELTSVAKEDIGNLYPKLANAEAFLQQNVEFNSTLSSLQFEVEDRGSRHFILITSSQPINEPYMEILVELSSSSGRLIREYPLLLNLPDAPNRTAAAGQNAAPPKKQSSIISAPMTPSASNNSMAPPAASIKSKAKPKVATKVAATEKSGSPNSNQAYYKIKKGDTLGKIAKKFNYSGISLDQMLVALQRSNGQAVIRDNMNLIRAGAILTIPDRSEVERIDPAEAKKIVVAQAIDFNAYREKLANQVARSEGRKKIRAKKMDGGKITAKVIEKPTAINEASDKLKLSKPELAEKKEIRALEEDKIANQKALEAANTRIKELEENTAKLKKILELQNEGAPSSDQAKSSDATTTLPKIEANVPSPATAGQAPAKTKQPPLPAVSKSAPESTQRFFDNWLRYLPYGAVLLALLAGGIFYLVRRKKKIKAIDEVNATPDSNNDDPLFSLAQATQPGETIKSSSRAAAARLSDDQMIERGIEKEAELVAEAEAYISYGRDDQAEEILKEALRRQPGSPALRVKLLEIYAQRKDVSGFEAIASELYAITGGVGREWVRAAEMGMTIDSHNPLYSDETKLNEEGPAQQERTETGEQEVPGTSASEASATSSSPAEFDLSGIDLELPEISREGEQAKSAEQRNSNETSITSTDIPSEEMTAKLDLALAYQKIGDKQGAREILSEVLKNGTSEQIARANAILRELT